jgi:hypothetical protein
MKSSLYSFGNGDVQSVKSSPTIHINMSPPSSGKRNKASKEPAWSRWKSAWHYVPQDRHLRVQLRKYGDELRFGLPVFYSRQEQHLSCLHCVHTHPFSYPSGTGPISPVINGLDCEAINFPPFSSDGKRWSYTSTTPYILLAECLINEIQNHIVFLIRVNTSIFSIYYLIVYIRNYWSYKC